MGVRTGVGSSMSFSNGVAAKVSRTSCAFLKVAIPVKPSEPKSITCLMLATSSTNNKRP